MNGWRAWAADGWTSPRPRWGRADLVVAGVAALAILVRWGDRARWLLTWDAHMFALALRRYDVNALRPHAPGYPVYVLLGKMAHAVVPDVNDALVLVSLVATAAAAALTWLVGVRLFGRGPALAATSLFLAMPLVHIHAMTANSYAAEVPLALGVAWLAWRAHAEPTRGRLVALAAVFAVAVGVRQSLGFFLTPLVLWAALRPPWTVGEQARRLAPAAATGVAVGLAWFVPMVRASGGLQVWRRANALQSLVVFEHPAWRDGVAALRTNADRIALYLQWERSILLPVLAGLVAVAVVAWLVRTHGRARPRLTAQTGSRATWLVLWSAPAALFYLLVYSGYGNGPSGYMLLLLPPMALASAWVAWHALASLRLPRFFAVAAGLVATAVVVAGLASHAHDAADVDYRENDRWAESWSHLAEAFPPSNTSIVTAYNFAHLWLYEPEYHVYEYRPAGKAVGEVPDFLMIQVAHRYEATPDWYDEIADHRTPLGHTLPEGTRNLVLFDFQLAGENGGERAVRPEIPVREGVLPNGWRILYVETTPDRPLLDDYFTLEDLGTG